MYIYIYTEECTLLWWLKLKCHSLKNSILYMLPMIVARFLDSNPVEAATGVRERLRADGVQQQENLEQ